MIIIMMIQSNLYKTKQIKKSKMTQFFEGEKDREKSNSNYTHCSSQNMQKLKQKIKKKIKQKARKIPKKQQQQLLFETI